MGKRKALNNHDSAEKKAKPEPVSDESDFENESDQTLSKISTSPDEMLVLSKSFLEFLNNRKAVATVRHMDNALSEWVENRMKNGESFVDTVSFNRDHRIYLRAALKLTNLAAACSIELITKHLEGEKALDMFADFPSRPTTLIMRYIADKNLSKHVKDSAAAHEQLKAESAEYKQRLKEEQLKDEQEYNKKLEKFLEDHPNLTETQKNVVQKRIKGLSKKTNTPKPARQAKVKKEPITAFQLWMKTKTDKYTNLPAQEREEKLMKKYKKLSEDQIRLLEELALTS